MRIATWVMVAFFAVLVIGAAVAGTGCADGNSAASGGDGSPVVLADTGFMADIAQNIAGDRLEVKSLLPVGADPHSFEPTPRDGERIARSAAVIINTPGFEPLVEDLIAAAGQPGLVIIEAAAGLAGGSEDPHFWLDPTKVVTYGENIRRGLTAVDPAGAQIYAGNAEAYERQLAELDAWIASQVATIPAERRLLVTNHESLGHFAKRYGFEIVGAVFPSTGGEGSPSAQQMAALVEKIRRTGAPAIFLEAGGNADLSRQVARETGVKLVTDLYLHSLGKNAPTYIDMMRWDVRLIVEALK